MKVVYVVNHRHAVSETFVREEISKVRDAGVDVDVLAFQRSARSLVGLPEPRLVRAALRLERSVFRAVIAAAMAKHLYRRVRRSAGRVDIIHAHFASSPALIAALLAEQLGAAFSFTAHANDYRVGVQPRELRARVNRADRVFAISEFGMDDLARRASLTQSEARKLRLVRAQTVAFGPPARSRVVAAIRNSRASQIVTVARLVRKKGIDDALRVVAQLQDEGYEVHYHVIGEGPERHNLVELSRKLQVEDLVTWHGALPHEDALRLIEASDIAILPCRFDGDDVDGIPVFLMEAVASSVPVVTTRISGIPELLPHAVEGGDASALTRRAAWVLNFPAEAAAEARSVRDAARLEFDGGLQANRLIQEWTSMIQRGE